MDHSPAAAADQPLDYAAPALSPGESSAAPYDAAGPVPSGYDVICEQCGYSLVGLAGSRCPECGAVFDPAALPFARIPWLHRRRLGRWGAYWQTVRWVLRDPHSFAAELCRPVRISADDARRFRKLTTHLGALSAAFTWLIFPLLMPAQIVGTLRGPGQYVIAAGMAVVVWVCALLFFRLATDMPLFIWQGLPNLPPSELAPLHHYAAAPLALSPLAMPMIAVWPALALTARAPEPLILLSVLVALAALAGWLFVLWRTPQVLMKTATRCGPARVTLLALYLPVHWMLMAAVVCLGAAAVSLVIAFGLEALIDGLGI